MTNLRLYSFRNMYNLYQLYTKSKKPALNLQWTKVLEFLIDLSQFFIWCTPLNELNIF